MTDNELYNEKTIYQLYEKMEAHLKHHRYVHSIGVAGTAVCLAMKYGENCYKAQIAGILHDCAKCYDDDELIELCKKNEIEISDFENENGFLLHAKYGAHIAEEKYKICDEDILSAIKWHTTGRENMSLLEKIIFVADFIEPTRNKVSGLDDIRSVAFNGDSIDEAVLMILKVTIDYLSGSGKKIDTTTMNAYEYYKGKAG